MTPRQRAEACEALEELEKTAAVVETKYLGCMRKMAEAIRKAAEKLRDALPNPDQPDVW